MLRVYGQYMPIRTLEEIVFWKMQEREHTVVIRALAELEPPFVEALHKWEGVLTQTEDLARQYLQAALQSLSHVGSGSGLPTISPSFSLNIQQLEAYSAEQSQHFVRLLELLLQDSKAVAANPVLQIVIHHIIRESEYFLGVIEAPNEDGKFIQ